MIDAVKQYKHQYYLDNKEKLLTKQNLYYLANKNKISKRRKIKYKFDRYRILLKNKQHNDNQKYIVITQLGGKCTVCGETHLAFLTIDHINELGHIHRKEIKIDIYTWLIKNNFPPGFQVLCYNCNWKKHLIYTRKNWKSTKTAIAVRKNKIKLRNEIFDHFGGKCNCCNASDYDILTIHHCNNDGAEHRKKTDCGTGVKFYRWLKNNDYPKGFGLLCRNCNCATEYNKFCPHTKND